MTAHEAIRNLLGRYCEVMDTGEWDIFGSLFSHGELHDDKGRVIARGAQAVTDLWSHMVRLHDGSPRTCHLVSGPIIEVDEDNETATCRSSYAVLQQVGTGPMQPIATGRYHDTFALIDGEWHFTVRKFFLDHEGDMSQHMVDL